MRHLGIFSSNESFDDVKTEDLGFLLVEFYIGQLLQEVWVGTAPVSCAVCIAAVSDSLPPLPCNVVATR